MCEPLPALPRLTYRRANDGGHRRLRSTIERRHFPWRDGAAAMADKRTKKSVPVSNKRAREEHIRALEAQYGLGNTLSETCRAMRHAASHAALLAGPVGAREDTDAVLQATATELKELELQRQNAQHRAERDDMGRDLARQRRERQLDIEARQAHAERQRKRKEIEKQEAQEERKRLREQIAADRAARRQPPVSIS